MTSLMRAGIIQPTEGPNRTKRWREGDSALYLSWDICLLLPLDLRAPDFQAFGLRLEFISSAHLVLKPWDSDQITPRAFPVLCRQQTMGFLSLHNCMHPFLPCLGLLKHFSVFYFNVAIVFFIIFLCFLSGCSKDLSIHI